jgi:hypothetical protein
MSTPAKKRRVTNNIGGYVQSQDSPFERARKRLDDLNDPDAAPKPPQEVLALKSTRALEDWDDLMMIQDIDLWGAVDLSMAAQLICLQEMCRTLQFRVMVLEEETEMDRWGNRHPSAAFKMWQQSIAMANRLRSSMGFTDIGSEKGSRNANRRAKRAIQTGASVIDKAMSGPPATATPPPPLPLAGTDITA